MKNILLSNVMAVLAVNGMAFAQKQAPTVVRGTIDSIIGNALKVRVLPGAPSRGAGHVLNAGRDRGNLLAFFRHFFPSILGSTDFLCAGLRRRTERSTDVAQILVQ
jgi:hypothetical protein